MPQMSSVFNSFSSGDAILQRRLEIEICYKETQKFYERRNYQTIAWQQQCNTARMELPPPVIQ